MPRRLYITFVAVALATAANAAADLALRAYPNPFTAGETALIAYVLPAAAEVDIRVFTIDGKLVRTVAEGVKRAAGAHLRDEGWNGRDDDGELVGPGPYVIVLEARDGQDRRDTFVAVVKR